MKTFALWITLITGESGPVSMPEYECHFFAREFAVSKSMQLPVTVERQDGSHDIVTNMVCVPNETETAQRPTS